MPAVHRVALAAPVLAAALLFALPGRAAAGLVYIENDLFTNTSTVSRANLDGSGVTPILHAPGALYRSLALDPAAQALYLTDTLNDRVQRVNLDGTGLTTLIAGQGTARGVALDGLGHLYWTGDHQIRRANLDGSGVQAVVTGLAFPDLLALDVAGGKVYWTDLTGKVQRANLDGTGVEDLVTGLGFSTDGLALNLVAGQLYFTTQSEVLRANLDGSGLEVLVGGLTEVNSVNLDLAGGKLYWTDSGPFGPSLGLIGRANLDGSAAETILGGLRAPAYVLVEPQQQPLPVPAPPTGVLLAACALALLSLRGRYGRLRLRPDSRSDTATQLEGGFQRW
jgi:hypothetical protein